MMFASGRRMRRDPLRLCLWLGTCARQLAFFCWGSLSAAAQNAAGFGTRLRTAAIPGRYLGCRDDGGAWRAPRAQSRTARETG
jgi:hypothetical protein